MVENQSKELIDRYRGCLIGGAVGDALGAPVEFDDHAEIVQRFGPDGICNYVQAYGRLGAITDDTQMTLFTAEGLLRTYVRGCLRGICSYPGVTAHAYLRWLKTQGYQPRCEIPDGEKGWLFSIKALHTSRAPGKTCLSALQAMESPGAPANNDSKGCGGVMRVAPVGLFTRHWIKDQNTLGRTFKLGCDLAALTHGHPSGYLSAGVFAVLVMLLADGNHLPQALKTAKAILQQYPEHEEILGALTLAEMLAEEPGHPVKHIERLGGGWVAEEALAIAVYCALKAKSFEHGITMAVNHGGDSDSTGAIAGNLLGAMHGLSAIPARWLADLELREEIGIVADDLLNVHGWDVDGDNDPEMAKEIWRRYPGY